MEVDPRLCRYVLPQSALPTRQAFDGYRCKEPRELGKSHCIFHDPKHNKESGAFSSRLVCKQDHCFIGYVFPIQFKLPIHEFNDADFAHSIFHSRADFQGSTFQGRADFSLATFHQGVHCNKVRFNGDVHFIGALVSGQAWFSNMTLNGYFNLSTAQFKDEVWFDGNSDVIADMIGTIFEGEVHFHNTVFATGRFIETQFKERATFGYFQHLGNVIDLEKASQSPGIVFFEGVDMKQLLFREANLKRASFNHCYNLDQAKFYECSWNTESGRIHVLYDELQLRGRVLPWEETAAAETRSRKCILTEETNKNLTKSGESRDSLLEGKYAAVEETCRALKKHFEDRRNFLVAGDFHEGEMEMRRLAKGPWGRNILSIEAIYWLLSRYGQSWLRPLACFIALNLTAAVIYSFSGLQLDSDRAPIRLVITSETSLNLVLESLYVYLHALLYSFSVSALLRGVYATPTNLAGLFLQTVQFIVGPLLILLIGLAIRRRVRR